jgi:hypothetical protein
VTQPDDDAVGERGRGGGAGAGVEERELAEHLTRALDAQQVLASVDRGDAELHLAVDDDVEAVAGLALDEDRGALVVGLLDHRGPQSDRGLVVECREQRSVPENVVHSSSSCAVPRAGRSDGTTRPPTRSRRAQSGMSGVQVTA